MCRVTKMVVKLRTDVCEIFVQALYTDDMPLLKTIIEGMRHTRVNHLQSMLNAKSELGGFTPFEFACLQGNATLATMLIDTEKVDVDRKGQCDWTPLHAAAYSGDARTVQVLLNSCADCFARDENNNLPLDLTKDANVRELLSETMKKKNLQKFEQILSDYQTTATAQKTERFQQRSKSCFANVSVIRMNELKTRLVERKQSSNEFLMESGQLEFEMKRWKTCSDLSLNTIFNMTC